jgi:hypothetical protein
MDDDIETLRDALLIITGEKRCLDNLMGNADVAREAIAVLDRLDFNFKSQSNEIEIADETIDRLKADRDSLRKALDDRHAPPDLTWFWEIVDRDGLNNVCSDERGALAELVRYAAERDSLRAKLDRAKEVLEPLANLATLEEQRWENCVPPEQMLVAAFLRDFRRARSFLSELSADASAQFPKCRKEPVDVRDFIKQHAPAQQTQSFSQLCADKDAVEDFLQMKRAPAQQEPGRHLTLDEQKVFHSALRKSSHVGPAQPPQIRDDVRSLLDEAIAALEVHSCACGDECFEGKREGLAVPIRACIHWKTKTTLTKLRAARNG